MKKLEDIPKKHSFEVPEGYFDKLPGVIQSRIAEESGAKESKPYFRYVLQYALPVIILAVASIIYFVPGKPQDVDSMLASVSMEELVSYLEQTDISTEELLNNMELDNESVEAIESEVYFNFDGIENIDELNLDTNNL